MSKESDSADNAGNNSEQTEKRPKPLENTQIWHRPPLITPNFGRRKKIGLKSNVNKVLLHDNVSQQTILQAQINNLCLEEKRNTKLLDLHKKSFLVQQSFKQMHLRTIGVTHISFIPDAIAEVNCGILRYRGATERFLKNNSNNTDLPPLDNNNNHNVIDNQKVIQKLKLPRTDSAGTKSQLSDDVTLVDTSSPTTRTQSAFPSSANPKTFMTHNYRMRREKTIHTVNPSRGKSGLHTLRDPRYISLRKTLVSSGTPVDGYLQLSPSGQYVLRKYGQPTVDQETVHKMIHGMIIHRPNTVSVSDVARIPAHKTPPTTTDKHVNFRKESSSSIMSDID